MSETKEKKIEIQDNKTVEDAAIEEILEETTENTSEDVHAEESGEAENEQVDVEAAKAEAQQKKANMAYGEAKKEEVIDWQDRCLRVQAELANATKTIPKRIQEGVERFKRSHFSSLLELADGFDRAAQHMEESSKEWQEGFGSLQRILLETMSKSGVEKLDCKGQIFDPNWHEVVSAIPNPQMQDGEIMDVVRAGYKLDGKLLRAAMVVVAKN